MFILDLCEVKSMIIYQKSSPGLCRNTVVFGTETPQCNGIALGLRIFKWGCEILGPKDGGWLPACVTLQCGNLPDDWTGGSLWGPPTSRSAVFREKDGRPRIGLPSQNFTQDPSYRAKSGFVFPLPQKPEQPKWALQDGHVRLDPGCTVIHQCVTNLPKSVS